MTWVSPPPSNIAAMRDDALLRVRRLGWRYVAVLAAVAGVLLLDQAVLQPLLVRLNLFAPAINVAGRQRMLSQRLTKCALAMERPDAQPADVAARRRELQDVLQQWSESHRALRDGDHALGLHGVTTPPIAAAFGELEPHFIAMRDAAAQLVHSPSPLDRAERARLVERILGQEAAYLPTMDRIVDLYEQAARTQVAWLRLLGLAATGVVLLLLVSVGLFVLRPATRMIHQQVQRLCAAHDELEVRVAERTAELAVSNDALQRAARERRAAEADLRQLSAQLAHASRVTSLGELATGLAHELNQPLAAIANYAETSDLLLDRRPFDAEAVRGNLHGVQQAALRAGGIIRRLRNFVRRETASTAPAALSALLHDVVELCRLEIAHARVELVIDLPSDLPMIEADAIQVQQVLVNLMQNSLQAMQQTPGYPRRLTVRASADAPLLQVEVRDTGPGFQSEDCETLFAPYFTTKSDGLGMGLAISRTIVQRHGGRMWAANHPDGGASVYFTLPFASLHEFDTAAADCVCR